MYPLQIMPQLGLILFSPRFSSQPEITYYFFIINQILLSIVCVSSTFVSISDNSNERIKQRSLTFIEYTFESYSVHYGNH